MKIIIAAPLFPPEIADVSYYCKKLTEKLAKNNKISVVTYTNNTEMVSNAKIIQTRKSQKLVWRLFDFTKKLYSSSKNTEMIYCESSVAVSLPALIVSKIRHIPLVIRFGEDESWERSRQLKLTEQNLESFLDNPKTNSRIKAIQRLQKFIITKADSLIVPSDLFSKIAEKHYKVNPEIIIKNHNPIIKLETLPFDTPVKPGQISTTADNNLEKIISSISKLKNTFSHIELTILGKPKNKKELKKLCQELKINDRVKFLDSISNAEIYYTRKTSDIFILNSHHEKSTDAIISCFSNKTPVIANTLGKELITNNTNGIIIKKIGTDELSQAITRFLSDNEFKTKIQENAYNLFIENLTWKNHVKKLEEIFDSLKK